MTPSWPGSRDRRTGAQRRVVWLRWGMSVGTLHRRFPIRGAAMSDATPRRPSADRNLLFGILALQMDFIRRDALIAAMNAWVLDKAKPLGQVLVERQALRPDQRA